MYGLIFRLLALPALICSLQGQNVKSTLTGTVLDPAGRPIAGARVSVVAGGNAAALTVSTDATGSFSIPAAPGAYTLRISKEGFSPAEERVDSTQSGAQGREILLQVAPLVGVVTVTENAGYQISTTSTATKTQTPLRDIPQSITVVTQSQIRDQLMMSVADVVRYVPGITAHQGENNRDQVIIRGNNSSADFFVNGVRDDVQYYRDLYNLERVEALKGPNAMIFGRGGGGGVINRVTKEAGSTPLREVSLQGGSFGNKRVSADVNQPFGEKASFRMNGMYENSDSFRRYVNLERYGVSPTLTILANERTRLVLAYEHFRDYRVADRGITSFQNRPANVDFRTFYGNPGEAKVKALVNLGSATLEHQAGRVNLRNRTHFGGYDRFYRNFVPGAASANGEQVAISSYDNATQRLNAFNQTDVTYSLFTGSVRHTVLTGAEFGRQSTDNFRDTGYFNNTATSISVPFYNPTTFVPVTFRQSATDANNHVKTNVAAAYLQDQVSINRYIQVVGGVRFDRFDLQFHNRRTSEQLQRVDNLISPRLGLVIKPASVLSVYANYSVSYLPSSGDQFASLTTITQQVKPEKFTNYEAGVKWDVNKSLALTTAVYRLDRTNTRSTDPNDPTRIVQTGSQRTNGFEFGWNGSLTRAWQVSGGVGYQDAFVTSATTAAKAGAQVAQVPHHTFSLWNNYRILPRLGAGLGILNRGDMFAAIDNTVALAGYTRVDAALFYSLTEKIRLQANAENITNRRYFSNADNNTNISPGAPFGLRVGLTARF
ncbi:MAG: TonB-dependent siderophore receptor [Acidobacteria bacterium]|nr:TonB-dependent siderophore receptor [Acidobacteriota bacterium]